jgi:hypothetical protein
LDALDIIPVKEAVNMAVEYENLEVIDFLYSKKDKYEFDTMSTYIAAEHANLNMLKKLKTYGVSLPIFLPHKCYKSYMVRQDAEFVDKMKEVVDYLIKHNVKILFQLENPVKTTSLRRLLL